MNIGNKLAWNYTAMPFGDELIFEVDLSKEPLSTRNIEDIHRIWIRKTSVVMLEPIKQWIEGKADANSKVQEALNFMNQLISQSLRLDPYNICLKRSFFARDAPYTTLPGGLFVKKGLFCSVRGGTGMLTVNVDVSTAVFWPSGNLLPLMQQYMNQRKLPMSSILLCPNC